VPFDVAANGCELARIITQDFPHPAHDSDKRNLTLIATQPRTVFNGSTPELSKLSPKHLTDVSALGRWYLSLWFLCLERLFLWYLPLCLGAAPYAASCALLAVP
jgi:hypothetical protein